MYKKIVDDKKIALQIGAVGFSQEDYGMYILYGLPMGNFTTADLLVEIDEEIVKIQTELISENDELYKRTKYIVEGVADDEENKK